jgi:hypothetical protein
LVVAVEVPEGFVAGGLPRGGRGLPSSMMSSNASRRASTSALVERVRFMELDKPEARSSRRLPPVRKTGEKL